ncbi:MAG: glycosyltransferase family 2 protein [Clostridium sp.]|nr:glycosyltransferase family 2 protein [Clostridium sp.]
MKQTSSITLVIPVFNREKFLERTFRSIDRQTLPPACILLVDNASTDGSRMLCETYARRKQEHESVSATVLSEPHPGAAHARNRGLAATETPYVYFFDSDDELSSDFFERMEAELNRHTDTTVDAIVFSTVEVRGKHQRTRPYDRRANAATHILNSMLNTQSMLFRTEWLRNAGGWDSSLTIWMDWELGVRLLLSQATVVRLAPHPFHRIHIHPDSITGSTYSARYPDLMRTTDRVLHDIETAPLPPSQKKRTLRALYYRQMILSAKLLGEGDHRNALHCRLHARRHLHPGSFTRLFGFLLHTYTRMGGRGAWMIGCIFTW